MKNLFSVFMMVLVVLLVLGGCKSGKKTDGTMPEAELAATGEETQEETSEEGQVSESSELQRIHFDYDKYNIRGDSQGVLEKNASYLKANPDAWIQVEGHCDERGSAEYNLALGEKRANAAKKYLVALGISAKRISVISYGEEKSLEAGADEYAWSMNRRAEFVIVSKGM